jgi:tetratricopeptide (TPR) repeat protein
LGVHGEGASPLRRELERMTHALRLGPAEAERRFREVVAAKPDVSEAWLGLGYLAADRGALETALECFDRAVAGKPYFMPGSSTLLPAAVAASAKGRLLEQAGRLPEAEASYSVAIAAGAKNDIRRRYARLLRARGALDEACIHFDRAVPWDGRAHPFPKLPRLLDDIVRVFQQ